MKETDQQDTRPSIALVGMRGTGKTTIGRILAARLHLRFVDTDEEVVRVCGCSIAEIFRNRGEPAFRHFESEALTRISASKACVIAVGGGAVLRPGNVEMLRKMAYVIRLLASPKVLAGRVAQDPATELTRPPLTKLSLEQELALSLCEREALYREAADLSVETEGRSADDVADEIVATLANRRG